MARVFSGVQPSGALHLGNYLGAFRQWVGAQGENDALYCVVDLHALTLEIEPAALRAQTYDTACGLLAVGLDPDRCTLFVQSQVSEHTSLDWLLECTATYGELQRMTQFKEKAADQESVRAGLLTYPVLMAADILLYDTDSVPVGDDQRQHLELARDLALRFNYRYGETFVVPAAAIPAVGARVMDLQVPERKMSKSSSTEAGLIFLDDTPEVITRKIRRAVTDSEQDVTYEPTRRPGVSNLLDILAGATGVAPATAAATFSNNGELKKATAEALIELLGPIQERLKMLRADPGGVERLLYRGSGKARSIAAPVLARARAAIGLMPE
ncbi:MAG TPA: tryptophan--tRNA ligase [Acidimicrobiales bacterium]